MSKRARVLLMMTIMLLLSACGTKPSWENDPVTAASSRLLSDDVQVVWTVEGGEASGSGGKRIIRLEI